MTPQTRAVPLQTTARIEPMTPVSRAQKVGAFVAAAQKTLVGTANRHAGSRYEQHRRLGSALMAGAKTTLLSAGRVVHLLWLQIAGLFFLVFAAGFAAAAVRLYRTWSTTHADGSKLALLAAFAVLFAWFGVTSFWRASRSYKRS